MGGRVWLPRVLFWLTCLTAAALVLLVALAPWLEAAGGGRVASVFARDTTLRRTSLASALGLVVTAVVFFQAPPARPPRRRPPWSSGAGA